MKRLARLAACTLALASFVLAGCSDATLDLRAQSDEQAVGLAGVQTMDFDAFEPPEGASGLPVFGVDISLWSGEISDEEVGCWYEEGVRHVIVGTQNHRIMRQQFDEALEGGMSVDAYTYLYWDDVGEQVREDVELLKDYPVGRLWIDVEQDPEGRGVQALEAKIAEALEACGDMPCGIYTGAWWWEPFMRNSSAFADVPLWYAWYDEDPSMLTWDKQKFGGWERPWGKQWQEIYFCGIDVDKNTIFVDSEPTNPPKSFEPLDELTAPTDLYPDDLVQVNWTQNVRVLADTVPGATEYEFEVQHYGSRWLPYHTFRTDAPAADFSAVVVDRVFRFRARASNASDAGEWSDWAYFEMGRATNIPDEAIEAPEDEPDPETDAADPEDSSSPAADDASDDTETPDEPDAPTEPMEEDPETVAGAPSGLTPAHMSSLPNGRVTLSCDPMDTATTYEWQIENYVSSDDRWVGYFTYTTSGAERGFYPVANLAYRWRVRATVAGEPTPYSDWHHFSTGTAAPVGEP